MKIAFCHHLSLSYNGGGEKWLANTAKYLAKRGHDVQVYALPILMDGKHKSNPNEMLDGIPYKESFHSKVKADVTYITYNPLSWLNFETKHPRIAGLHSHAYWQPPNLNYGLLPNIANLTNRFTSYFELRRYDAIHAVTDVYPINHPSVYHIPNYVDSEIYSPCNSHLRKYKIFTAAFASRQVWQKGWNMIPEVRRISKHSGIDVINSGDIPEHLMPMFYSNSHVTIVPSIVDTFGMSIIESEMCETPVITTNLDTHKSLGLNLKYADTVPEYVAALSELKAYWESDKQGYLKMASDCRKEAMKYDKKLILSRLERMFKEVAQL